MISEIQEGLYGAVNGINGLDVFGHVPQNNDIYPYVVVKPIELDFNDFDSETGFVGEAMIHVWSKYKGSSETATIQKQIYDTLHRQTMSVTGYNVVSVQQQFTEILLDPDGITRQGVQRYQIIFEPIV